MKDSIMPFSANIRFYLGKISDQAEMNFISNSTRSLTSSGLLKRLVFGHKGSFKLDNHLVDSVFPLLNDPVASLIYLYLLRHDRGDGLLRGSEDIAKDNALDRSDVMKALQVLKELKMIDLSHDRGLFITINKSWVLS